MLDYGRTGEAFGKWKVLKDAPPFTKARHALVECICGLQKLVSVRTLLLGTSTGCLYCRPQKHGLTRTGQKSPPLLNVWASMIQRCENSKDKSFHNYGGRGISVCPEWHDFYTFYQWALSSGWQKGIDLDREDNDGSYEPSNCRWVTRSRNNLNRRCSVRVTMPDGKLVALMDLEPDVSRYRAIRLRMLKGLTYFESIKLPFDTKPPRRVSGQYMNCREWLEYIEKEIKAC